jgi:hypothetical protein
MSGWLFDFFVSPRKAEFYQTTAETRSPSLPERHVYRPYRSGRKNEDALGSASPSSRLLGLSNQALLSQVFHNLAHAFLDAQLIGPDGDLG